MNTNANGTFPEPPLCDDRLIWRIFLSRYSLPALMAGDELGIFQYLEETPATTEQVAKHCEISTRGAEPLLGLLCSLGLLTQNQGTFLNTETARTYLLPQSPYYWGAVLELNRSIDFRETYLLEAVKNKKQFGYAGEGDIWESNEFSEEMAAAFTAHMHSFSFGPAVAVSRRGNFDGVNRLLDVAGGSGCFSIALAKSRPEMQCTILELPWVCPITERYIADFGVSGRVDTVALNMFTDDWPQGYDAVFLSHVFHDWDYLSCERLAQKAYEALPSAGRIYLHECLLNDTFDGPADVPALSMNMVVWTEGKQYTAGELEQILEGAGFGKLSITNTHGFYSLVSAQKLE